MRLLPTKTTSVCFHSPQGLFCPRAKSAFILHSFTRFAPHPFLLSANLFPSKLLMDSCYHLFNCRSYPLDFDVNAPCYFRMLDSPDFSFMCNSLNCGIEIRRVLRSLQCHAIIDIVCSIASVSGQKLFKVIFPIFAYRTLAYPGRLYVLFSFWEKSIPINRSRMAPKDSVQELCNFLRKSSFLCSFARILLSERAFYISTAA